MGPLLPIMISAMSGAGSAYIDLEDFPTPLTAVSVDPSNCKAGIRTNSDGSLEYFNGGTGGSWNEGDNSWFSRKPVTGIGSSYWVRMTKNSGSTLTTDAGSTWLAMSSTREWSYTTTGVGTLSGNFTLEIAADSGGSTVLATKTFNMSAERTL